MIRVIHERKLPTDRYSSHGANGSYYKLSSRRGIKVMDECFDTKEELLISEAYYNCKREFAFLGRARKSGFTPKPYEMVLVKLKHSGWTPAIIMQHINGVHPDECDDQDVWLSDDLANKLMILLEKKCGIEHGDMHDQNVIWSPSKKRYYIIDFGNASDSKRKKHGKKRCKKKK